MPEVSEEKTVLGYIGNDEVLVANAQLETPFVDVELASGAKFVVHGELYGMIVTEQPIEDAQSYREIIFLVLSKKFLAQLQEYNVPCFWVGGIGNTMVNLIENAHHSATTKLWDGKHPQQVTLQDVDAVLQK